MNRIIQFAIFFIIFSLVYFFMNYYVIARLAGWLGFQKNLGFWILVFSVVLSFPLSNLLVRLANNWLLRTFYTLSVTWLGVLFSLYAPLHCSNSSDYSSA